MSNKLFKFIIGNNNCILDAIIYIKTAPPVCFERLLKRNRSEEFGVVTLKYLEQLHQLHENWLVNETSNLNIYKPSIIIIIDGNKDPESIYNSIEAEIKKIL